MKKRVPIQLHKIPQSRILAEAVQKKGSVNEHRKLMVHKTDF
jgi:hypothetical protein